MPKIVMNFLKKHWIFSSLLIGGGTIIGTSTFTNFRVESLFPENIQSIFKVAKEQETTSPNDDHQQNKNEHDQKNNFNIDQKQKTVGRKYLEQNPKWTPTTYHPNSDPKSNFNSENNFENNLKKSSLSLLTNNNQIKKADPILVSSKIKSKETNSSILKPKQELTAMPITISTKDDPEETIEPLEQNNQGNLPKQLANVPIMIRLPITIRRRRKVAPTPSINLQVSEPVAIERIVQEQPLVPSSAEVVPTAEPEVPEETRQVIEQSAVPVETSNESTNQAEVNNLTESTNSVNLNESLNLTESTGSVINLENIEVNQTTTTNDNQITITSPLKSEKINLIAINLLKKIDHDQPVYLPKKSQLSTSYCVLFESSADVSQGNCPIAE